METITFTQSNYNDNYNAFQLSLPLDLGLKIDPDDEVVSFLKALEGVNLNRYLKRKECRGRKGYDNVMLLKAVLFARMIGSNDLRSLESAGMTSDSCISQKRKHPALWLLNVC